jgi:uncharacterized protein (DUF1778 family)
MKTNKEIFITFRVTEEERKIILDSAKKEHRSLSNYIRLKTLNKI